ncbi:MAG: hypothetical protein HY909_15570 [Deltaproteobacteria bacterium]|nr:hypothetical protein [Deltaproteobacteria bacterium]
MTGLRAWAVVALLGFCRREPPPVGFPSDTTRPPPPDARRDVTVDAPAPFVAVDGLAVPGDGTRLALPGGAVAQAPEGERFGLWLPADLDRDGQMNDALATRVDAQGQTVGLWALRAAASGATRVAVPDAEPGDRTCAEGALRRTSPRGVVLSWSCARTGHRECALVGEDAAPGPRFRAALVPPVPAGTSLALHLEALDEDGDGQDDAVVTVTAASARPGAAPRARARALYLRRGGVFARDLSEPEGSLTALVRALREAGSRRRGVSGVLALSEDLQRLRRALCAEAGAPQVLVNGAPGVPCGAGAFAGAPDAMARALLSAGEYPAVAALLRRESAGDFGPVTGERVASELRRAAAPERGVTAQAGPFVGGDPGQLPAVRIGVLSLEAPTAPGGVRLRGPVSGRVDLATMVFTGSDGRADEVLPRALSGDRVLVGFAEGCDGEGLVQCNDVAACAQALQPGTALLPVGASRVLLSTLTSDALAARCRSDGAAVAVRAEASLRVLGLGADGLLVAWRGLLYRARPNEEPRLLGPGEALGGPYPAGGGVSENGACAVLSTPEGVWLRERGGWRLLAPPELAGRYGQLTDLTVSDDGRAVVGLLGTQLWVLRRAPRR